MHIIALILGSGLVGFLLLAPNQLLKKAAIRLTIIAALIGGAIAVGNGIRIYNEDQNRLRAEALDGTHPFNGYPNGPAPKILTPLDIENQKLLATLRAKQDLVRNNH